jgi:hypothetical protein
MKFVDDCCDIGAPEFCVSGVSAIERISQNMVRVSYLSRRKDGPVEVCHIVWDAVEWRKTCEMISRACEGILAEPAPGQDDRPRLAH